MISGNKRFKKLSTLMLAALFVGLYGFAFMGFDTASIAAEDSATANSEKPAQAVEAKPQPKPEPEEVDNATCLGCHNADILKLSKEELADQVNVADKPVPPRAKPPYVFGELNLSIDEKKYGESVHKDLTCISCHKDIPEIPHNQRLALVDCKECHEDSVESIQASAHGKKAGPKAPQCVGCHNVHYGQAQSNHEGEFKSRICLACHAANGMNTVEQHKSLQQPDMHMKLGCLVCHKGDKPGVHNIPAAKGKTASCEQCHNQY
ncbi:MAG: cytochrome c3 family protein, partial [Pseudomonadota bacterium]